MRLCIAIASLLLSVLFLSISPASAETAPSSLEQAMSDTLDLWRDGRYEQLYERLSHRGKTSREQFVSRMREASIRPACCWQKMENFKVLNEKRTEATVYVKVGLEGTPGTADSCTRDFKLSHEGGTWKMQLNDIFSLAGISGKKARHGSRKHTPGNTSTYHR
ncbi:MAG: hypothetical protein HYV06_10420 [Deltaproteobacteria bacterium]|nr:hypothetical protein [Deltaproteobacteria bacterium]